MMECDDDILSVYKPNSMMMNQLTLPSNPSRHEKNESNMSLSTIPLDKISVMAPSSIAHSDGIHCYEQDALREEEENEEEEEEQQKEQVSDHEEEFEKKKKRKKRKKKKRKKNKRKKMKKAEAEAKQEIEYEPDFVAEKEGLAANHHPPQNIFHGVLAHKVAMDKVLAAADTKGADMQSTVSSHPAFDAKKLKPFMDGMRTGNEEEEESESDESISSNTSSNSAAEDEFSSSSSNVANDVVSLASADPYPLHDAVTVASSVYPMAIMASIQEDYEQNVTCNKEEKEVRVVCLNNDPAIYELILSFMCRHDRWLHCRLVCKLWHKIIFEKCWIFVEHLSMTQADCLKIGDKVDHRDDAGRFIKSTILGRHGSQLRVHYDGWSSKWDLWCDYRKNLHKFALSRSISRCPRVRAEHIEEGMFVDVKPSYRHGTDCKWRKGKVRRLDEYSGQIEVIYKFKKKNFLLWVHVDNKNEVDRWGKHSNINNV